MFSPEEIRLMIFMAPFLLMSLVVHEVAHARTAYAFGDPTARLLGRCSFNPLVHLDPIGTIALFLVHFGWAKPVPVNPANLNPRRLGDIMVSLAGPLSNLALAAAMALILHLIIPHLHNLNADWQNTILMVFMFTIIINLMLFTFNLIPLYPLDGHHIVREILPWHKQQAFMHWQLQYGRFVLLALIFLPRLLGGVAPQLAQLDPIDQLFGFVLNNLMPLLGLRAG